MMKQIYIALKRESFTGFCKLFISRLLTSLIAVPIVLIILMIYPIIRIHLIRLLSYRIGHYALNTELLLCALDDKLYADEKRTLRWFYTFPEHPICNSQLHIMWKRIITILPFPLVFHQADRFLSKILVKSYKNDPYKLRFEPVEGARDLWNYLEKKKSHLAFNKDEIQRGTNLLNQLGIPDNSPFVCLLGRDDFYLNSYLPNRDWSYQNFRNVNINDYQKAALYLVEKGYYVVRMGKGVKEKFAIDHSRVIDYANHPQRSDFLDIYLAAHCFFFISPRSGIDAVAQIFRRHLLVTNLPLGDYKSLYFIDVFIPKKLREKPTQRLVKFKEIFNYYDLFDNRVQMLDAWQKNGWHFEDNTPDEILEAVQEMLSRVTHNWNCADENQLLQDQFWQTLPNEKNYTFNLSPKLRIGEAFIKNHQALLN